MHNMAEHAIVQLMGRARTPQTHASAPSRPRPQRYAGGRGRLIAECVWPPVGPTPHRHDLTQNPELAKQMHSINATRQALPSTPDHIRVLSERGARQGLEGPVRRPSPTPDPYTHTNADVRGPSGGDIWAERGNHQHNPPHTANGHHPPRQRQA